VQVSGVQTLDPYQVARLYEKQTESSGESADQIVPLILDLAPIHSVIDIGCGVGSWLSVFMKYGLSDFIGVDSAYTDKSKLAIPEDRFIPFDLNHRFELDREFDLVISLEVAEHLSVDAAEIFVDTLTSLGPLVLFSAAIPYQGGLNHINEQWPDYWVDLFRQKKYMAIDFLRSQLCTNENTSWWYAQNMMLYVKEDQLDRYPNLLGITKTSNPFPYSIVHPRAYLKKVEKLEQLQLQIDWLMEQNNHLKSPLYLLSRAPGYLISRVKDLLAR
jgi:hypothetical protein